MTKAHQEPIVIYGVHPVQECLEAAPERARRLWVMGDAPGAIQGLCEEAGVPIEPASRGRLEELSGGGNHQGVALEASPPVYAELDEVLEGLGERAEALVVVLDQVQDVGNLGAILRSAAAFGAHAVVIPRDRAASVTAAVVRTSAGQALRVPVAQVVNIRRALEQLKEVGFWVVGTQVEPGQRTQEPWGIDMEHTRVALVLGGEHGGVRRLVGETCDFQARVPMAPGVESLNVATAAGVLMYEVVRQWGGIK